MKRDIAIVVLNYIQYINIMPGIKELINRGYNVDFYCPKVQDSEGYGKMFNDIRLFLINQGYNVYETNQKIQYKVVLEPYPEYKFDFNSKYFIRYRYGNLSAKPSIVYKPENYLKYDCILCSGDYDSNYLSVFSRTVKTGNMKYINFKRKQKKSEEKKKLLYLPTYGNESSLNKIQEGLQLLKKDYYIISKIHHGTSFLKIEEEKTYGLKDIVDEYYDYHKELKELIEETDVILTDNSGSVFEALYTNTPVAIFCENPNSYKLESFDTIQYELIKQKIVPYCNSVEELPKIIKQAQTSKYLNRQKKWNKNNFYHPTDLTNDFVNIIEEYLKDDIDKRYFAMHKILKNNYYYKIKQIEEKNSEIALLKKEINNKNNEITELHIQNQEITLEKEKIEIDKKKLEESIKQDKEIYYNEKNILMNEINYYKTGKLYKIANKIYRIKNGGK